MVASYLKMLRLFGRDIRLFLICAALVGLAWDGMRAVILNLYLLRLGYGPEFIGLINGLGALAFGLLCPVAGAMGTRWGSRSVLIVGTSLLTAGFGLLPLAESLPADWRSGWLIATTIVTHLGFALYLVNGLPFMMDASGTEERIHVFSVHSAVLPLAAFAGSLLAGALPGIYATLSGVPLTEAAPYRFPLWLSALLLAPCILVLLSTRSVAGTQKQPMASSASVTGASRAPWVLILAIALVMALRFGGRGTMATFLNVYLDEGLGTPTALIGALTATAQLLSVPAALAAPLLVARWGESRAIFRGTMGMALFALPLALIPHWAAAGFGFISSAAFFSMTVGPMRLYSQELVAPRWRATMAASFMMGAGLAFSAVSLAGGYVIVAFGYEALFLGAMALMAACGLLFWALFRVPHGKLAPQPSPEHAE
ncbi:MAG: MFS transporter [Anaerolineae bacterium]|jgi:MFS family permease